MDDLHLEIESISSCGADHDRDPQPSVSSRTSSQDNSTSGDGSRTPTVTAGGCNQRVAETAGVRSSSTHSGRTADACGRRTGVEQRENLSPQTGIGGRETIETPSVPVLTETSTQIARDSERRRTSGPAGSQTLNQTNASPLIEEPPPLYSSLFPAASATNNRQPQCQHQSPYHRPSHTIQHHLFAQRCSVCHPTPHHPFSPHDSNNFCPDDSTFYSHQHLHHIGPALPGATGQHYPEHQSPMREQAQYHSTIVPMHHHHGAQQQNNIPDDYMKLSFACVLLCSLHLNLPALICVLPALAYSIRTQKLNAEGRHSQARQYSKGALTCNLLAFCQYIVVVVVLALVLYILFSAYF